MTGVVIGRGGPYAKRKEDLAKKTQAKTARDVEAEKALAERAAEARREDRARHRGRVGGG